MGGPVVLLDPRGLPNAARVAPLIHLSALRVESLAAIVGIRSQPPFADVFVQNWMSGSEKVVDPRCSGCWYWRQASYG
jgi:hypothetical protein